MAAAGTGGDRVGHVDPHPQQRSAERLPQVVSPERSGSAATQRVVHHELEGQHVRCLEALNPAFHQFTEVRFHPVRSDLGADGLVGVLVIGEQRQVADVALVA